MRAQRNHPTHRARPGHRGSGCGAAVRAPVPRYRARPVASGATPPSACPATSEVPRAPSSRGRRSCDRCGRRERRVEVWGECARERARAVVKSAGLRDSPGGLGNRLEAAEG